MHSSLPKTNVEVDPKIQLKIPETTVAAKPPGAETAPVPAQISDFSVPKAKSGYQCAYCMKRFGKKAKFERHIQIHTQERPFKCDNCSLSFNCQSHWKRHTFSLKRGPVQKCFYCELTFCFQNTLIKHLKDLHADAPSEAPGLPAFLKSGEEDKGPMLEEPRMEEPLEDTQTSEISQAKQQGMKCLHSDLTFSNKQSFLEHTNDCHEDSSIINDSTSTRLQPAQNSLEKHSITPEIVEFQGKHICSICNKIFRNGGTLELHFRTHTNEFQCDSCSYTYTNESNIARHKQTRARKEGIVYSCDKCSFKSCTINYLRMHTIQIHLEEHIPSLGLLDPAEPSFLTTTKEAYSNRLCVQDLQLEILEKTQEVCHFCKKVFGGSNKKSLLEEHIRIHTGEGQFKCTQCSYNCAEQSDLDHHERRHLILSPKDSCPGNGNMREKYDEGKSVKPFKCTYCNYKSGRLSSIRYHERSHKAPKKKIHFLGETTANPGKTKINSGENTNNSVKATVFTKKRKLRAPHKMYKCEFCPYESKQQGIIVAHTRIHTGEKPFKCQYCPYKSAWVYALKNHEERHVERGDKREIHQTPAQPELPQELSPVVPNKLLDEQSIKNRKRFKDRLFNYRSYRSAHVQNDGSSHTTRKKQFDCKICGAMFDQLSSLLNHREAHYIY